MSSSAQLYAALQQSAQVGVQRLPIAPSLLAVSPSSASHQALLAACQRPSDNAAQQLLRASAVATTLERCGWQPAPASQQPLPAAAPERRPAVQNPQLRALLQQQFADGPAELLPLIYQRLGAAGLRLPEALLPPALEQGRYHTAQRPWLAQVLGERGRWLGGINPQWGYAAGVTEDADAEQTWQEGSAQQRLTLLQQERQQHPGQARDRLAASLKELSAKERLPMVQALATGLSAEDEPLLEQLLTDRSKEVRAAALNLLSCLPASAHSQRMQTWLQAMLQPVAPPPGMLQKIKTALGQTAPRHWQIEPPQEADPAWEAAGLQIQPPAHLRAPRAWWLQQIVALTPLQFWQDQLGLNIEQLWAWSADSDWKSALRQGWFSALEVQRDTRWLPLLTALMRQPKALKDERLEYAATSLWSRLLAAQPAAEQEAFWLETLADAAAQAPGQMAHLLSRMDTQQPPAALWSARLSARVLQSLPVLLGAQLDHYALQVLHRCARRLSDCQLPAFAQLWRRPDAASVALTAPLCDNPQAVALLDFVVQLRQALPPALSDESASHA